MSDGGPRADSGPDSGPATWLTNTLFDLTDAGVRIEIVSYLSEGLRVEGEVCRPDDDLRHPVVMSNHGGFQGFGNPGDALCVGLAASGYVVGASSYRGEDQSEGQVEVCLGEVTDVQNMMAVLRGQPYVDPTRFAAFGASHGGCITLALALREPTLKAAVDFFGPSDLASAYAFWQSELDQGEPPPCPAGAAASCVAVHNVLIDTVKTATGGTPTQVPQEYAARSPVYNLGSIAVPLMILQGTDDYLVDLNQTCEKRAALISAGKPPAAWLYDSSLTTQNSASVCGGNFRTSPPPVSGAPGAWTQDDVYLLLFQGQGHGFSGPASQYANAAAIYFLLNRL